jgi:fructose-specific PTS system IIA-like component
VRERAVDIEDIGLRILEVLHGGACPVARIELTGPTVLVADDLTPRQLLSPTRRHIRALVLEHAGTTSHVVLLARSMGVPTLVGVENARANLIAGDEAIVDAHLGVVIRNPQAAAVRYYDREADKHRLRRARLLRRARRTATPRDSRTLDIGVNVNSVEDLNADEMKLADGIGLLRTEMVFSTRESPPTEEEQYTLYASAVEAAGGKTVIVRTFDVGADKPLPFFSLPKEANPALGFRGVRNYDRHPQILRSQLRAIVRASATGPVRLMAPMVGTYEEAARFRERVSRAQAELREEGVPFDAEMPVGVMVEVPLLTHALDDVCDLVDFISIGTNDLAQYFAAADRCNASVAGLANVRHPAFLRLLSAILESAHERACWVGMCGDMASDPRNLPLLLGLGLDEISVIASEVPGLKDAVRRHEWQACRRLLDRARSCKTADEVERLIDEVPDSGTARDMLSIELIAVEADCASKAEAIKHLIDLLYIDGRTNEPRQVEDAVWTREEHGGTGLGHGFAIPHCKCGAVAASSVAVARLREPIEWGSLDGKPVTCVILLAMCEADPANTHMRVFSTLARRLMHEAFREGISNAADAEALHAFVSAQLGSALMRKGER